jgi:hypothetical protein
MIMSKGPTKTQLKKLKRLQNDLGLKRKKSARTYKFAEEEINRLIPRWEAKFGKPFAKANSYAVRSCRNCHEEYLPTGARQAFCTENCKFVYNDSQRNDKPTEEEESIVVASEANKERCVVYGCNNITNGTQYCKHCKAKRKSGKLQPQVKKTFEDRFCKNCNKIYTPTGTTQQFCGLNCKAEFKGNKGVARVHLRSCVIPECNNKIELGKKSKYCTDECKELGVKAHKAFTSGLITWEDLIAVNPNPRMTGRIRTRLKSLGLDENGNPIDGVSELNEEPEDNSNEKHPVKSKLIDAQFAYDLAMVKCKLLAVEHLNIIQDQIESAVDVPSFNLETNVEASPMVCVAIRDILEENNYTVEMEYNKESSSGLFLIGWNKGEPPVEENNNQPELDGLDITSIGLGIGSVEQVTLVNQS